jgi:hypothetical protein
MQPADLAGCCGCCGWGRIRGAGRQVAIVGQLELQLEELEASATEDEIAVGTAEPDPTTVLGFTRKRPVRGPWVGLLH